MIHTFMQISLSFEVLLRILHKQKIVQTRLGMCAKMSIEEKLKQDFFLRIDKSESHRGV